MAHGLRLIGLQAVICLMLANSLWAAVPQRISHQGRLTDGAGTPVADGPYLIKFTIYDAPVGGSVLWNSGFQNVSVIDGLFTYVLGVDVAFLDGLFSGGSDRWLGITVGVDPEIAPRTQLLASAYSLHSQRADTTDWSGLSGVPAGFADGVDDDAGGDITAVSAGAGLIGGGVSGSVAVSVDFATTQQRVTGTAPGGAAITGINVTGIVATPSLVSRIDHPLDPENKYLQHSFVESPEMTRVYSGNIVTDDHGLATVEMPDYFESRSAMSATSLRS